MIREKSKRFRRKGFFISFEGVEGSGKSTHLKRLALFLKSKKLKVITTKEPGGTKIGRRIRKILLDPRNTIISHLCELFLFLADRCEHIEEKIIPFLKKGYIVLTDRYADSTIAYQAAGRSLDVNLIKRLNRLVQKDAEPDLTFLLDTPVDKSLRKVKALSKEYKGGDRLEQESVHFHKRIRKEFYKLLKENPRRIIRIKLEKEIDQTQERIQRICLERLKRGKFL